MTPAADSVGTRFLGDVLAPTASSLRKRALDGAALATGAAPGVADPVQPVAAKGGVFFAQPYWMDGDRVKHPSHHPALPVTRQCLSCGVVAECDPALPCGVCNASPFHLIPLAPKR